jgi:CheY-like chemotaxis protein
MPDKATLGARVLVVEDEAMVLMGYRMLFESWGYRVLAACSVEDAMDQLADHPLPPDVIVADFRLTGGETGVQAVRLVEKRYGGRIPAILITGDTAADRLREAASSGLPVLHKPVNGRKLQSLLEEMLS